MRRRSTAIWTARSAEASVVIWTTTPWTIPGNRAISFSSQASPTASTRSPRRPTDNWAKAGDKLHPRRQARRGRVQGGQGRRPSSACATSIRPRSASLACAHPLARAAATHFDVPLLDGDHVTDDAGTGFVHTAPGHGREDFDIWMANEPRAAGARHRHRPSPTPSTPTARFTKDAPGFEGKRVIDDKGEQGRRQRGASSRRWPRPAR